MHGSLMHGVTGGVGVVDAPGTPSLSERRVSSSTSAVERSDILLDTVQLHSPTKVCATVWKKDILKFFVNFCDGFVMITSWSQSLVLLLALRNEWMPLPPVCSPSFGLMRYVTCSGSRRKKATRCCCIYFSSWIFPRTTLSSLSLSCN